MRRHKASGEPSVSLKAPAGPGDELVIPAQVMHSGRCLTGTRTIHAFGGKRAEREGG